MSHFPFSFMKLLTKMSVDVCVLCVAHVEFNVLPFYSASECGWLVCSGERLSLQMYGICTYTFTHTYTHTHTQMYTRTQVHTISVCACVRTCN